MTAAILHTMPQYRPWNKLREEDKAVSIATSLVLVGEACGRQTYPCACGVRSLHTGIHLEHQRLVPSKKDLDAYPMGNMEPQLQHGGSLYVAVGLPLLFLTTQTGP